MRVCSVSWAPQSTTDAWGEHFSSDATSGIDPPEPICSTSLPKISASAASASPIAGADVSAWKLLPALTRSTSTLQFHGVWARRWSISAASWPSGSAPGAIRT